MKDPMKISCNLFGLGQQLFEWIITERKKSLRQQGDWLQSDKEISALYLSANTAAKKRGWETQVMDPVRWPMPVKVTSTNTLQIAHNRLSTKSGTIL